MTELARVPGTTYYADRSRPPEKDVTPGVLVIRCESALVYFNVEYVRERVFELLNARRIRFGSSSSFSAQYRESIWPAPSSSPNCNGRSALRGIEFPLAGGSRRGREALHGPGSNRGMAASKPVRPSIASLRSGWLAGPEPAARGRDSSPGKRA